MSTQNGLILVFDYGLSWIGVAVGQRLTGTATPQPSLRAKDGIPDWSQIEALIKKWEPVLCLIGKPINMDGTDSEITARAIKFSNRIHGRFSVPVALQDERLTSFEAKGILLAQDRRDRDFKKRDIDSLAAQLIFESWCNEQLTH